MQAIYRIRGNPLELRGSFVATRSRSDAAISAGSIRVTRKDPMPERPRRCGGGADLMNTDDVASAPKDHPDELAKDANIPDRGAQR